MVAAALKHRRSLERRRGERAGIYGSVAMAGRTGGHHGTRPPDLERRRGRARELRAASLIRRFGPRRLGASQANAGSAGSRDVGSRARGTWGGRQPGREHRGLVQQHAGEGVRIATGDPRKPAQALGQRIQNTGSGRRLGEKIGAPGTIRTSDPQIRRSAGALFPVITGDVFRCSSKTLYSRVDGRRSPERATKRLRVVAMW